MSDNDVVQIQLERHESAVTVAHVTGDIDLASADTFRAGLAASVASGDDFVLDLGGVTFMGSLGFSALVETHHETERRNIRWAIVTGSSPVSRPLKITGLEQVLPIYSTVPDALAALHGINDGGGISTAE
nr:STAS domain-containing protein [Kibdelosporangium sp. MJ126-NF4]CEL23498.1 Anti-sigma F factor antagonist (spoIIAA-2); Anti-sigma B factor antagonist RsbV [Kibdelosporangium sp. MJ126-NF4]CTQ89112.1 Anti-sigma F factor antagonist (spoIIAA-2); Anti-sigma B factor antagonist RsbV [Kibdelosporangium sp. MJ126-NF4]